MMGSPLKPAIPNETPFLTISIKEVSKVPFFMFLLNFQQISPHTIPVCLDFIPNFIDVPTFL